MKIGIRFPSAVQKKLNSKHCSIIPVYGFGDAKTQDRSVFSLAESKAILDSMLLSLFTFTISFRRAAMDLKMCSGGTLNSHRTFRSRAQPLSSPLSIKLSRCYMKLTSANSLRQCIDDTVVRIQRSAEKMANITSYWSLQTDRWEIKWNCQMSAHC